MTDPWYFEVLPYRPPAHTGECLSGYLMRLAHVNGFIRFWDLAADLFPMWGKERQVSLLRWEYPVDGWGRIPLRTQLSLGELRRLTVAPWLEKFRAPLVVTRPGHLSPGHFLRGVVTPDLQVCPLCLQAQPYCLRLIWRLASVDVCIHHGCLLQAHCHRCGASLPGVGPSVRHLHCAGCDTDWRTLPVVMASADHLAAQQRRQAALQFLLDPAVTLVRLPRPENAGSVHDLAQTIGLKFRYLRLQAGYSVTEMARRIGVHSGLISTLEIGGQAPLHLYVTYLETLSLSWPDFAALEVPLAFWQSCQEPPHLDLRLCPTPTCPNHQPPPSTRVSVLADLPEQKKVRFRCTACGRNFTRTYDGEWVSKPRRPPIGPGEPPPMVKPAEEIAQLIEMGLRGEANRQIARRLGWGEKTVRIHWIALGLEDKVHQAQAQRQAREQKQRHAARRAQVEAALQVLFNQEEEITLRQVSRALGHNSDYLHSYPDLAEQVWERIRRHNAQVRQRRYERLVVQTARFIDEIKHGNDALTLQSVARQIGLSLERYRHFFPELHALVREVIEERQAAVKTSRTERECAEVNAAAARLVVRGARLSCATILQEAGLSKYRNQCDPVIHDLLQQWIGGFAPRD